MTTKTDKAAPRKADEEVHRLREENERLREALEGLLVILGNPAGYCENDRIEVEEAVAEVERALGRRPPPTWRRLHPPSKGQ